MSVRTEVWNLLAADPILNGLGINSGTLYPGLMAPDSPKEDKFAVLHWGISEPGPGRDNPNVAVENLSVWAYNRSPDYDPILRTLQRCKALLVPTQGTSAIMTVNWQGDSEDLWDDVYRAVTRNSSYRISSGG